MFAWFLSILLWPYALQSPVRNVLESYQVMAHFPGTFRQIFEGKVEWSDFMPWYYLPKSMVITIPLLFYQVWYYLFFLSEKYLIRNKVFHLWIFSFYSFISACFCDF